MHGALLSKHSYNRKPLTGMSSGRNIYICTHVHKDHICKNMCVRIYVHLQEGLHNYGYLPAWVGIIGETSLYLCVCLNSDNEHNFKIWLNRRIYKYGNTKGDK